MRAVLVSFLYCAPIFCSATTILSVRTNNELFVAADSRIVNANGATDSRTCKIKVAPNHIFAAAGLAKEIDGPFDIFAIADKAMTFDNIEGVIASFEKDVLETLPLRLPKIRGEASAFFDNQILGTEGIRTLFGVSDGTNIVEQYIGFFIKDMNTILVRAGDPVCPTTCRHVDLPWFIAFGEHSAVDVLLKKSPDIWSRLGIIGALNKLIQTEIEARPDIVGGPISIASLRNDGKIIWYQRGYCGP